MKITVPKEMRGAAFPSIFTIELNAFDVDRLLQMLFLRVLGEGRMRGRNKNDPTAIQHYVDKLAAHPHLQGFDDADGRVVLEKLVRTALITITQIGRSKQGGEQIASIVPYTLLAYKPGFPKEGSLSRNVDNFIYHALKQVEGGDKPLQTIFKKVFGKGIHIDPTSSLDGRYDGTTNLDTLARISAAFVDGFEPIGVITEGKKGQVANPTPPPCPELADQLARDLLTYLLIYHRTMPPQALTHYWLGLVNLELFIYTLKTIYAVNKLVQHPDILPPAMRKPYESSPPSLYLDFTGERGSLSQEMATACVRRDIEAYHQFMSSNLLLRLLHNYADNLRRSPRHKTAIEENLPADTKGAAYLQGLLLLQNHPDVQRAIESQAQRDDDDIYQENLREYVQKGTTSGEENINGSVIEKELLTFMKEVASIARTDVERVVAFLAEAQQQTIMQNYNGWYRDAGGLNKPYGLLDGNTMGRKSWRYAPRNDLLEALVQLAVVRQRGNSNMGCMPQSQDTPRDKQTIRLHDFLNFLECRFGILVARPPEPFHGADYAAAASDNLRAMLRRLRQMGIFRDLSDDFTAQELHAPYAQRVAPVTTEER